MRKFIQFSDAGESAVTAVFCCPQDPDIYEYLGELDDTDPRYQSFISRANGAAAALRAAAQDALARSDVTILRCVENDVPVPQVWRDYRATLRAIISTPGATEESLPPQPSFPAGT